MKTGIRLYKCHDMDLILLKSVYHVNLGEMARLCLKAYVNHEFISFNPIVSPDKAKKYIYKKYQMTEGAEQITFPTQSFSLNLYEHEDRDCIEFLNSIIKGYRNMFVKQLLRMYLRMPMFSEFMVRTPGDLNQLTETSALMYDIPLTNQKEKKKTTREEIEKRILKDKPLSSGNEVIRQKIEDKILRTDSNSSASEQSMIDIPYKPDDFEMNLKNEIHTQLEGTVHETEDESLNSDENEDLMDLMAAWIQ